MSVNRRELLALVGAGVAAPALSEAQGVQVEFLHGVASGDPLADRLIIWTRVSPAATGAKRVSVNWTVAEDAGFTRVATSGSLETGSERDHTVKIDVGGLKPGRDYWYRFTAGARTSPVGRARTLPIGRLEHLTLAFVTCSLYPNGYFNAYHHIAQSEALDAVVE